MGCIRILTIFIIWSIFVGLVSWAFWELIKWVGIQGHWAEWIFVGLVIVIAVGSLYFIIKELKGVDPFKWKFKQIRKKRKYIRVNHRKYLSEAKKYRLTYIGYDRMNRTPFGLDDETRTRHIHILGSTGSGKSVLMFNIFKQDVETGGGVIFIDAKGDMENKQKVINIVKSAGREEDLLIFTLSKGGNTYNPLVSGNPTQLKDKLIASIIWSEPYYLRICENLLQLLFSSINQVLTLKDLYEILNEPTKIYKYGAGDSAGEFMKFAAMHKREIATLTSETGLLVFSDFYENLNAAEPDINFLVACKERKIVYIGIDVQSYQETGKRIGRMITEDINTTSGIIQTTIPDSERRYFSILIDEFQAFGTVNFVNTLSRGRSSGFMITIAHQSLADLEMIRRGFSKQVIDNTHTKIVLPIQDPDTIQTISDIIGTYKEYEHTKQVVYSGPGPGSELGTVKLIDEYIIHPNDIKQLRIGEAVYKSGQAAGIIQIPYL